MSQIIRRHLQLTGLVQGVGMRPWIAVQARARALTGYVRNCGGQVLLEIQGLPHQIDDMIATLRRDAPGVLESLAVRDLFPREESEFHVIASDPGDLFAGDLPVDQAPCAQCLRELSDPADRRHGYPLISCNSCGPRWSIMTRLPWDRENTTLNQFPMCPACRHEYTDPGNRRFHAQTTSCPDCGPAFWIFARSDREGVRRGDPVAVLLEQVCASLTQGGVVVIKGTGGYQLLVRADDEQAVARLRDIKQRPDKPFVVMGASAGALTRYGVITPAESLLMRSPAAPVVLLQKRMTPGLVPQDDPSASTDIQDSQVTRVLDLMAPSTGSIGCMLPSSPLHHLILQRTGLPLVVTSANLSGYPMVTSDDEALQVFAGVADCIFGHDLVIRHRVDDAVAQVVGGRTVFFRHGRGTAPRSLRIAVDGEMLGAGAEMKNAVALSTGGRIVAGPHVGSVFHPPVRAALEQSIQDLTAMLRVERFGVVTDMHPQFVHREIPLVSGASRQEVQHHVAHLYSCMAEHGLRDRVIGLTWDGNGFGLDGDVWGGEVFVVDGQCRRTGSIRTFPLIGGDRAAREPWRVLAALLWDAVGPEETRRILAMQCSLNPSLTGAALSVLAGRATMSRCSSMGRLFDGVACLLGVAPFRQSYEGQAPQALEYLASRSDSAEAYEISIEPAEVLRYDWRVTICHMLHDLDQGVPASTAARKFHTTIMRVARRFVLESAQHHISDVALSGGVFQNRLLVEGMMHDLSTCGKKVHINQIVPGNDAGIGIGQLYAAALMGRGGGHVPVDPR